MVRGLGIFRERFRTFEGYFTLIGGAACEEWFAALSLSFRATKDLDLVLMVEVLDHAFMAAMRAFVAEGGYEVRERSEGIPILYRFAKPARDDFPFMLELFSRNQEGFDLSPGQEVIHVEIESGQHSLSASFLLGPIVRFNSCSWDSMRLWFRGRLAWMRSAKGHIVRRAF